MSLDRDFPEFIRCTWVYQYVSFSRGSKEMPLSLPARFDKAVKNAIFSLSSRAFFPGKPI